MEEASQHKTQSQKKNQSYVGIWFLIPLAVVFVGVFILAMDWKDMLTVKRVVVGGAHIISAKEIVTLANIQSQATIYETDLFNVQQRLLAQAMIKTAVVTRELPDALHIEIVERNPIAAVSNSQLWYIDDEGVILPHVSSTTTFDLPIISGITGLDSVRLGHVLNQSDVFDAIHILQAAQTIDLYRTISEVNMNNGGEIILYSTDGGVPIIIGRGDVDTKLTTLQSFWNQYAKSNVLAQLRSVDLRYDGQVVAKWDKQKEPVKQKLSL